MENSKENITFTAEDLKAIRKHNFRNKAEILNSELCGCISCYQTFSVNAVVDWVEEEDNGTGQNYTAFCPLCSVDNVIGSASGYPITLESLNALDNIDSDKPIINASSYEELCEILSKQ